MINKIYTEFQKNDKIWNNCIFYTIYLDENKEKRLKLRGMTSKYRGDNYYDNWGFKYLTQWKLDEKLSKLLEWGDISYGLSLLRKEKGILHDINLFDEDDEDDIFSTPKFAYDFANEMVKGEDNNGSKNLWLRSVKEETPCGNYFGIGVI